ncbi:hypothetical protein PLICRDRAFT_108307 [Plicaturopsis crispa FD-325 SS-3]|nr:hypothetical protein PLICRDRAFT_108307 [Plicaturopsis crispa FD-325 SS-3]
MSIPSALSTTKTVAVLGASFGGFKAARLVAEGLPSDWKVVAIDRNSHFINPYVLPRFGVLSGHEEKAFIPYDRIFHPFDPAAPPPSPPSRHVLLHGEVTALTPHTVTVSPLGADAGSQLVIPFDYAVYALGSQLPAPINFWGLPPISSRSKGAAGDADVPAFSGLKEQGISWLRRQQREVEASESILIVGGGALGIQYATDIASLYPNKRVTLLHSRNRLLPRYTEEMHNEILRALRELNVEVILGERLDKESLKTPGTVRTLSGRELAADLLLLCTGQAPNTHLLQAMDARTVSPKDGLAHILRTMQLGVLPPADGPGPNDAGGKAESTPYPHIFVVGDAADAFGAINAGRTAAQQGNVAAANVLRLVQRDEQAAGPGEELVEYAPGPPAIKVSLGMTKVVVENDGKVLTRDNGVPDLHAPSMRRLFGYTVDEEGGKL